MGNLMSGPKPPNPYQTAQAQGAMNKETAIAQQNLNMVDQYTPEGSLVYKQTGTNSDGTPKWKATTSYSPAQQAAYDQERGLDLAFNKLALDQTKKLGGVLSKPFQPTSLAGLPSYASLSMGDKDYSADRQKVEDAMFTRLNPQLERDRDALETKLVNQGLVRGSKAFNDSMDEYGRQANDARTSVILAGGQEQSRMADLDRARGAYEIGLRQAGLQEDMALRDKPINEIIALMNGQQISLPQFQNTPQTQVANTDLAGLVMDNYKIKAGKHNAMLGGIAGLAGTALGGWAGGGFKGV